VLPVITALIVGAVTVIVASALGVLAGSPSKFEANDGNMVVNTTGNNDWNSVQGNPAYVHLTDISKSTQDDSFASGQKQDVPCPLINTNKNPPKDDFTDVASFNETNTNSTSAQFGHTFLYGATIRVAPNGNADENVELNQGTSGVCAGTTNQLQRTAGDKLIAIDYTQGGTVVTFKVFTWVTSGGIGACFVSNDLPACWGANPQTLSQNAAEGQVNQSPIAAADNKINNLALDTGQFAEFGVDLTAAGIIPANSCQSFPQTIWESRASASSFVSSIEDVSVEHHTIGGGCTTTLSTQENKAASSSIGTGVVSSGTDTSTLTILGVAHWGGTLTWYLCGPVSTDGCDSHGVQVTSRTVSDSSPASDFISGTANLTSVGRYCWHAHFEPDAASVKAGVGPGDDNGSNECFTITAVTPMLTTSATCSASPCILGSTLNDSATLSGTASNPGTDGSGGDTGLYKSINATKGQPADNSISWTLYGPAADGSAQCSTTKSLSPSSVQVSGDGPYGPVSYTTSAATDGVGTYTFAASYPGQSPNTNAASDVTCANGASNGEQVTVTSQATTTTAQKWLPQDTATVTASGGATVAGTVTFSLYESADCSGSAVQTFGPTTVDSNGQATTNNQTYYTTTKTISWRATFTSTNGVASGSPSHCETMSVSTLNNDLGPGS
jgi:hypothetical protein